MLPQEFFAKFGLEVIKPNSGRGGSAIVHKCRVFEQIVPILPRKGTHVAVKEFNSEMLANLGQLERIDQEAKIGETVVSEHVAKIFGKDTGEGLPPSHCVLFMEWIEGPTLSDWVATRKPNKAPPWDFLRPVCLQIVKGVQDLHGAGILHRDLKPENIMLRSGTQPVIMDVGVAEIARGEENTMHTRVKDFLGSVRYAAPQYIQGEAFDPSDDVYALGCTFLELFTGKPPYHEVERKVLIPSSVLLGAPDVPAPGIGLPSGLDVLLRGCLHRDRSRRPSLVQLAEFFETGTDTEYTRVEQIKQYEDQKGWPILRVDGYHIYLDVGSTPTLPRQEYKVVRIGEPLYIPSTGRPHVPQTLIGKARFLHSSGPLAHFRFVPDIDSSTKADAVIHGLPAPNALMPQVGDRVVS